MESSIKTLDLFKELRWHDLQDLSGPLKEAS